MHKMLAAGMPKRPVDTFTNFILLT